MSIAGTMDARIGMAIAEKMDADERSINTISFSHSTPSQKVSSSLSKDQSSRESTADDNNVSPLEEAGPDEQPDLHYT